MMAYQWSFHNPEAHEIHRILNEIALSSSSHAQLSEVRRRRCRLCRRLLDGETLSFAIYLYSCQTHIHNFQLDSM